MTLKMTEENGYMSPKSSKEIDGSLNLIGLIILDSIAWPMESSEYLTFMQGIIEEDGDLSCIPDNVFQFQNLGPSRLPTMWTLDNYRRMDK